MSWRHHVLALDDLPVSLNTLRPRQNGRHFADDIFKRIFLYENILIPIKISLKFVPKGPTNNIPALVPIMAWRRPGDKPLSKLMMVNSTTHICVTRPQWVNSLFTFARDLSSINIPLQCKCRKIHAVYNVFASCMAIDCVYARLSTPTHAHTHIHKHKYATDDFKLLNTDSDGGIHQFGAIIWK